MPGPKIILNRNPDDATKLIWQVYDSATGAWVTQSAGAPAWGKLRSDFFGAIATFSADFPAQKGKPGGTVLVAQHAAVRKQGVQIDFQRTPGNTVEWKINGAKLEPGPETPGQVPAEFAGLDADQFEEIVYDLELSKAQIDLD